MDNKFNKKHFKGRDERPRSRDFGRADTAELDECTVIGRNASIYPMSNVRGTVPANSIYKTGGVIVPREEQ
jgi:hypothetical protein